ncbi:MAG: glycosyltransferase family 2 protein, partial [Candidatus Kariarchaeaceae archaeon]
MAPLVLSTSRFILIPTIEYIWKVLELFVIRIWTIILVGSFKLGKSGFPSSMRVSVIIPTFNRQDSVLRLLDSLCNQTITPESFEVIVVEDGSTSNLQREILNNYSYKIEYIWQENQGATIARNIGATNSRGQILIFVDDDISLSQNSLELLAD